MNVTIINDSQIFINAQEIIDSIKQYDSELKTTFKEKENQVRTELENAQSSIDQKDGSRLSKAMKTIKDVAMSIPANVIAAGIVNLITRGGF
jgi:predicted PurR-regulated permease PerM